MASNKKKSYDDFIVRRFIYNDYAQGPPQNTYFNDNISNNNNILEDFFNVIIESNKTCFPTENGVDYTIENMFNQNMDLFVVFYRPNNGYCGHASVSYNRPLSELTGDQATIGIGNLIWNVCIHPSARGHGLCQYIISTITDGMAGYLSLSKSAHYTQNFWLGVFSDNIPAIKCYESCGFSKMGLSEIKHKRFNELGEYVDDCEAAYMFFCKQSLRMR